MSHSHRSRARNGQPASWAAPVLIELCLIAVLMSGCDRDSGDVPHPPARTTASPATAASNFTTSKATTKTSTTKALSTQTAKVSTTVASIGDVSVTSTTLLAATDNSAFMVDGFLSFSVSNCSSYVKKYDMTEDALIATLAAVTHQVPSAITIRTLTCSDASPQRRLRKVAVPDAPTLKEVLNSSYAVVTGAAKNVAASILQYPNANLSKLVSENFAAAGLPPASAHSKTASQSDAQPQSSTYKFRLALPGDGCDYLKLPAVLTKEECFENAVVGLGLRGVGSFREPIPLCHPTRDRCFPSSQHWVRCGCYVTDFGTDNVAINFNHHAQCSGPEKLKNGGRWVCAIVPTTTTTTTVAPWLPVSLGCPAPASLQGQPCKVPTASSGLHGVKMTDPVWHWAGASGFGIGPGYHNTAMPAMKSDNVDQLILDHGKCLTLGCIGSSTYSHGGARMVLQCNDGNFNAVSPSGISTKDEAFKCTSTPKAMKYPVVIPSQGQACTKDNHESDPVWQWKGDSGFGIGKTYHHTVRPDITDSVEHGQCLTFGCVDSRTYAGGNTMMMLQCVSGKFAVVGPLGLDINDDANRCTSASISQPPAPAPGSHGLWCPSPTSSQGQPCRSDNKKDPVLYWAGANGFGLGETYHNTVRPVNYESVDHGQCVVFGCTGSSTYGNGGTNVVLQCQNGNYAVTSIAGFDIKSDQFRCRER